jgi:UDP-N-acetylglucosamine 2-epimerase (non-hydrolysing)
MKVATILGTRPEIIRLSRVIAALDRYTDHVLIHTGQNYDYELNQVFFEDLVIRRPDYFLAAAGKNAAETIGLVISKSSDVLAEVPGSVVGKAIEDSGLPHGSRKPLLRRAGSRGDQP